eukprot:SAG31_NODE_2387_length_5809_cov_1.810683_9_plen_104_part_00
MYPWLVLVQVRPYVRTCSMARVAYRPRTTVRDGVRSGGLLVGRTAVQLSNPATRLPGAGVQGTWYRIRDYKIKNLNLARAHIQLYCCGFASHTPNGLLLPAIF